MAFAECYAVFHTNNLLYHTNSQTHHVFKITNVICYGIKDFSFLYHYMNGFSLVLESFQNRVK